jgi:hypothetical protein
MQIGTNGYENANINALQNATIKQNENQQNRSQANEEELSVEEQINKSAVEVSLSMSAQIILYIMDTQQEVNNNTSAQKDILDFLSGKEVSEEFNLQNTGYEGKPITELTQEEATELISEDGFFGVEQTSSRVADFVLGFSGDDLEKLEAGREGIIQGFEDAQKMWGGELPQISHDTQTRTLELIDARIAQLKEQNEVSQTQDDETQTQTTPTQVDISV